MAQWYLRARIRSLLRARAAGHKFKARGAGRDTETDRLRAEAILRAIDGALIGAEAEYAGLEKRIDDVLAQAAIKFGDGTDEPPARSLLDHPSADLTEADALNSQRRLDELAANIIHYNLLKAALMSGLPDFKPAA